MKGEIETLNELKNIVLQDRHISLRTSNNIIKVLNKRIKEVEK
jgi:hypothetical protein